jgi:DnaJ like chaperone protein
LLNIGSWLAQDNSTPNYKAKPTSHLEDIRDPDSDVRQMGFTLAIIALAAKLMRLDGKVTKEKFYVFRELFPMKDDEIFKIHKLVSMAYDESTSFEHYARQVVMLFPEKTKLYSEVLDRLFKIATADKPLFEANFNYLKKVSDIFGIRKHEFAAMIKRYNHFDTQNPYEILGIHPRTNNVELKKRYHLLLREHHPDGLAAYGLTDEQISAANNRIVAINAAYDSIMRERGFKGKKRA